MSDKLPIKPDSPSGPPSPPSSQTGAVPRFSNKRLAVALAIAAASDIISSLTTAAPPIQWIVDFVTALLLFVVLGWQWLLLPGLVMEAVPGVGVLPFWVMVVGAIAVWGTARPKLK